MYTEVTRIRKPDPHVHEGDPNPVHTEVVKIAVFGSDICADLSGSWSALVRGIVAHFHADHHALDAFLRSPWYTYTPAWTRVYPVIDCTNVVIQHLERIPAR